MREYLFQHVDIDMNRTHVPQTHEVDLAASAARYDAAIEQSGGIDLQILGIGVDGHIGFNEVGSSLASRTRVKSLSEQTRRDNARYFDCLDSVPPMAITMGIGTIMEAREIVLLATGDNKARIIREAIEGPITASVPASVLQWHPNVTIFLDDSAAVQLQHRSYYMVSEANRMRLMGSKS
jgi:glucosamine-6-phosphate deaminase